MRAEWKCAIKAIGLQYVVLTNMMLLSSVNNLDIHNMLVNSIYNVGL